MGTKIIIGACPEKDGKTNKFLGFEMDGFRGRIIAMKEGDKEAIILAMNGGTDRIEWGKLYRIKIKNPEHWPYAVEEVCHIPNTKKWRIVV